MTLTKIGATLGGSANVIQVTQSTHGLLVGRPVKMTASGYAHATADTAANAEAVGIVTVSDWNGSSGANTTFTLALSGRITTDGCVPNVTAGTVLFLQVSAGLLAATEPPSAGQISKPMAVVTVANSEMIMVQQRGEVLSNGTATIADGSIDNDAMADDAIDSAELVAGSVDLAHMSVNSIDSDQYVDGSIDTVHIDALQITGAKIAANTITGDKIALGSDAQGDVMYYNGTDWVRLGFGTSGHFLKTQGTGANPLWAAAGGGPDQASQTETEQRSNVDKYIPPDLMKFAPGVGMCNIIGSNVSITSDTTYTGESEWTFPVEANHNYAMQALFIINSSGTADWKMKFVGPSGASGYWNYCCYGLEANSGLVKQGFMHNMASDETTPLTAGAAALYAFHMWGFATVSSTAGNVVFQWAQGTSENVPTVLWANSVMEMHNADIPNF